jgi:hypothetical protein
LGAVGCKKDGNADALNYFFGGSSSCTFLRDTAASQSHTVGTLHALLERGQGTTTAKSSQSFFTKKKATRRTHTTRIGVGVVVVVVVVVVGYSKLHQSI